MRPFGEIADLDLDFGDADRLTLVTTLLAQCDQRRDPALWWSAPVGRRIAALLHVVALSERRDHLELTARCVAPACGESFEYALPLQALARSGADASPMHIQLGDSRVLTMRRPTGADLRRWREAPAASRAEAVRLMLDTLILSGEAGEDDEATVSASVAAVDPLVDFTVACQCPACGVPNEVAVDLEALALSRLGARQRSLLQEVHRFASHYGWTEAEVLAVPAFRRARYVALMEQQS